MLSRLTPSAHLLALACLCLMASACGDQARALPNVGDAPESLDTIEVDARADTNTPDDIVANTTIDGAADTAIDAPDAEDSGPRLGPPYPIVLAHGMAGFEHLAGIEGITYFFGVRERLEAEGELVLTPVVDPLNSSERRGAQLAVAVDAFRQASGYEKVIIIGHSQGGLDARWVAHHHPDWVAAVVTYATPNYGTPVSDIVLGLIPYDDATAVIDAIVAFVGAPLYDELGKESSLFASLRQFSRDGIADFNARITDQPGVAYYSVTGRSDYHLGGVDCLEVDRPQFILDFQFVLDPVDVMLAVSEMLLDGGLADPYPNDGLVRVADAKWGRFLGCVPADHVDEVGQLLGDGPGLGNTWDHLQFFVDLVAFLHLEGH